MNLGLRITARRSDGYHELESVLAPLDLGSAEVVRIQRIAVDAGSVKVDFVRFDLRHPGAAIERQPSLDMSLFQHLGTGLAQLQGGVQMTDPEVQTHGLGCVAVHLKGCSGKGGHVGIVFGLAHQVEDNAAHHRQTRSQVDKTVQ